MIASSLTICPTDRNGAAQVFLRDGHGNFVAVTDNNRDFNSYAADEEQVVARVRAYFAALRNRRQL